jgi:acetyltransferase-like isoleucine patch superfamily enzyme
MPISFSITRYRIQKFLGLPKSLFLNFRYFGFLKGLKLPILLTHKVILKNCKGSVKILSPLQRGMITFGFESTPVTTNKEYTCWNVEGEIVFKGNSDLGVGTKIAVGPKGRLFVGNGFRITANSSISCRNFIKIGDDCLFSWEILLMDTDGHFIYDEKHNLKNQDGNIEIQDNVWLGCRCLVLKNSYIAQGSIVAAGSLLNSKFDVPNSLIAGVPATLKKKNLFWKPE